MWHFCNMVGSTWKRSDRVDMVDRTDFKFRTDTPTNHIYKIWPFSSRSDLVTGMSHFDLWHPVTGVTFETSNWNSPRMTLDVILYYYCTVLTFPYTLEPVSTLSKDGMNTLKSLYQILYHLVPKSRILWVLLIQKWNHWSGWRCGRGRATKLRGNSLSINTKRSRPISGQSDEF